MEGRDVSAVAKDDAVEGFALTLKLNDTPHNYPGMDNIVCPDMSDVLQLLRQLKGLLKSVLISSLLTLKVTGWTFIVNRNFM